MEKPRWNVDAPPQQTPHEGLAHAFHDPDSRHMPDRNFPAQKVRYVPLKIRWEGPTEFCAAGNGRARPVGGSS